MNDRQVDMAIKQMPRQKREMLEKDARARAKAKHGKAFWWDSNQVFQQSAVKAEMRAIYRELN